VKEKVGHFGKLAFSCGELHEKLDAILMFRVIVKLQPVAGERSITTAKRENLGPVCLFDVCTCVSFYLLLFFFPLQALINILRQQDVESNPENVIGYLRPFRIIISLLDKPEIGQQHGAPQHTHNTHTHTHTSKC